MSEHAELAAGLVGRAEIVVEARNTAETMKSGSLPVLATPAMVALMEEAACAALGDVLQEDETTVGISVSIEHLAATPLGKRVQAEARLVAGEGRKLRYEVRAADETGEIGRGTHERFIVGAKKFMQKAEGR